MNHTDFCLQRLLRSARLAAGPLPSEAPFHLEAAVMNAWRQGLPSENPPLPLPVLRGAFICALAILVISAALSLRSWKQSPPEEFTIVDNAIQLTLLP